MAVELTDDLEWYFSMISWIDIMHEGREEYSHDGDLVLPSRSALELVRADLTTDQQAALDSWDKTVRSKPDDFNRFFEMEHHREDPKTALESYVLVDGETPVIPRSHWWWRPLQKE